jgi:hypothetical protein
MDQLPLQLKGPVPLNPLQKKHTNTSFLVYCIWPIFMKSKTLLPFSSLSLSELFWDEKKFPGRSLIFCLSRHAKIRKFCLSGKYKNKTSREDVALKWWKEIGLAVPCLVVVPNVLAWQGFSPHIVFYQFHSPIFSTGLLYHCDECARFMYFWLSFSPLHIIVESVHRVLYCEHILFGFHCVLQSDRVNISRFPRRGLVSS